jgi:hypothetical protein
MTSNTQRWIHNGLAAAAIICSLGSLFALVELGAARWTTPLNVLALILVALAARTRRPVGKSAA